MVSSPSLPPYIPHQLIPPGYLFHHIQHSQVCYHCLDILHQWFACTPWSSQTALQYCCWAMDFQCCSPHSWCMQSSWVSQLVGRGGGCWHYQYVDHAHSQIWCYIGMPRLGSNTPPMLLFHSMGLYHQMNLVSGIAPPILCLLKAYKLSTAPSITIKNLQIWHLEVSILLARVCVVLV